MNALSRGVWIALLGAAIALPLGASRIDPFIRSERNESTLKFVREAYGTCAEVEKDVFGRCPTSQRSILNSRLFRGGGPGSGK